MDAFMKLIILAAGMGTRLRPLTENKPKAMVDVYGKPIIEWTLDNAKEAGISDITIIAGYRYEQFERYDVDIIVNERFEKTNMVQSLFCAQEIFGEDILLSYGDIIYSANILKAVLDYQGEFGVVVDKDWRSYWSQRFEDPLTDAESLKVKEDGRIINIGQKPQSYDDIDAQYLGLIRCRNKGIIAMKDAYKNAGQKSSYERSNLEVSSRFDGLYMTDLIQGAIDLGHSVDSITISGEWLEIDSISDHVYAEKAIQEKRLGDL